MAAGCPRFPIPILRPMKGVKLERTGTAGVLVLGASGFLGAQLVRRLGAAEARRRGALSGVCRRPEALLEILTVPPACALVAQDLAPAGAGAEIVRRLRPRCVFLVAALARPAACEGDPASAERLNSELPGEVAGACAALGSRLVHVSTDLVFAGRAPGGGYPETAVPDAASIYGRSKARGESAVLESYPTALVVRLPLLYGDSMGRGLGASDGLLAALQRGERPHLFADEWRTPLDVAAAAGALVDLAETDAGGLMHVAGPRRLSRLELGQAVLAAGGQAADRLRPAVRSSIPGCADRPRDVSLCSARALALLPKPLPSPEQALGTC